MIWLYPWCPAIAGATSAQWYLQLATSRWLHVSKDLVWIPSRWFWVVYIEYSSAWTVGQHMGIQDSGCFHVGPFGNIPKCFSCYAPM